MRPISEFYPQLFTHKSANIVIVPHSKPDADALGASVAWSLFLQKLGYKVKIISPTNWAGFLDFLAKMAGVIDINTYTTKALEFLLKADYFFAIDWNSWGRVLQIAALRERMQAKKILLDHHKQPELDTFDYGISLPGYSSSSEIILDQIIEIKPELLDSQMATAIYAGIIADTGSFRFVSTGAELHEKVAILLRKNIAHSQIHQQLFDTNTPIKLKFLGHILSNSLDIRYSGKVALMWVTHEDIVNYNIKTGDTEGLINHIMSMQSLDIGALISDRTTEIRLSFRSKSDNFDMSDFASKYFQGGGHKMAAGGTFDKDLNEAIEYFWQCIELEFAFPS